MGSYVSSLLMGRQAPAVDETTKKRKLEEEEIDVILKTPKIKKLKTTSEYIYETLFKNGENSDVTLIALGKCWRLHRVYLRQSPYFESMFMGNWKESHDSVVRMTIMDDNITVEALEVVLGFLYRDELSLTGEQVIGVLAAGVLLQLDPVIQYCSTIMRDTINSRTFLQYFHVANRYGVVEVEKLCIEWMERCLLTSLREHSELCSLPLDMLQKALSSPNLFVIQTEFSLYAFLKVWLFLQLRPNFEAHIDEISIEAYKFFKGRKGPCFLNTEEGLKYRPVFWQLRLVYIVNHYMDIDVIASDNILPRHWLQPAITRQWYSMLRIVQGKDTGPSEVPEAIFDRECVRCGRCFFNKSPHIWRWTGFNFDLDLVLFFDGSKLTMKRNSRRTNLTPPIEARKIMYRVTMVDGQRQEGMRQTSGLQRISFGRHEEVTLLQLDNTDQKYPLYLSANFLVYTPTEHPPLVHDSELLSMSADKPLPRLYRRREKNICASTDSDVFSSDDSLEDSGEADEVDNLGSNSRNEQKSLSRDPSKSVADPSFVFRNRPSNFYSRPVLIVADPFNSVAGSSSTAAGSSSTAAGSSSTVAGSSSTVAGSSSTVARSSSTVTGSSSIVTGSSSIVTGSSSIVTGSSSIVTGSSSTVTGPSSTVTGPSSTVTGPSSTVGRPSSTVGGPSSTVAGPSSTVAGPSSTVAGPSSTVAGPSSTGAGPSSTVAGPSSSVAGPSSSVAGPSSSVGEPYFTVVRTAGAGIGTRVPFYEPRFSSNNDELPDWTRTPPPIAIYSQPYSEVQPPTLIVLGASNLQRQGNDRLSRVSRISDVVGSVRMEAGPLENISPHPAGQVRDVGVHEYNNIEPNPPDDEQQVLNDGDDENHNFVDIMAGDDEQEADYDPDEDYDNGEDEYDQAIDDDQPEDAGDDRFSDDSDEALIEGDASDDDLAELEDMIRGDENRLIDYMYDDNEIREEEVESDNEDAP